MTAHDTEEDDPFNISAKPKVIPKKPKDDDYLSIFFVALIFFFLYPISRVADGIKGGGSGPGPALASFLVASVLVIGTATALLLGLLALGAYLLS